MPLTTSQEDALKQWAELRSLVDEALSVLGEIVATNWRSITRYHWPEPQRGSSGGSVMSQGLTESRRMLRQEDPSSFPKYPN